MSLQPVHQQFLNDHRAVADQALARMTAGPKGAASGFLSYEAAFLHAARQSSHVGAVWMNLPIYIQDAVIQGDHATVTYRMEPSAPSLYHVVFSRVGGAWYISSLWATGNA